jgi:hypothetical protein
MEKSGLIAVTVQTESAVNCAADKVATARRPLAVNDGQAELRVTNVDASF